MPTAARRLKRHVVNRTRFVFYNTELFAFRLLLGTSSLLYALLLTLNSGVFNRPRYDVLTTLFPWWVWALGFTLHGIGAYWRIYGIRHRTAWALLINGLGFFMWSCYTLGVNYGSGEIQLSTSMEITMCGFSGWVIYRTGIGEELLPP